MPTYKVTIVNGAAQTAAYAEDRRPEPDEAERTLEISVSGMSAINGRVQAEMEALGYERDAWKVLSWEYADSSSPATGR